MEDAYSAGGDGGRRFQGIDSSSCGFTADQLHARVVDKVVEGSHGVAAAATQAMTTSGRRPLSFESAICFLISLEMTARKSRTMVGNG